MFSLFKDQLTTKLFGSYATLEGALAAMGRNQTLVLPATGAGDVVTLNSYGAALDAGASGATVQLGTIATKVTLLGTGAVSLQTSDVNTRVFGNDADNTFMGNTARDLFYGGSGVDQMDGGAGDDYLYGGAGDDILTVGAGRDRAYGGDGDDMIYAGVGQNRLYGGDGSDTFVLDVSGSNQHIFYDFDANDRISITGHAGYDSLSDITEAGGRIYSSKGTTIIKIDDTQIQLRGFDIADLSDDLVSFEVPDAIYPAPEDFGVTDPAVGATSIDVDGVTYTLRDDQPLHEDFKFIDSRGGWWSPDYYVIVAGGQSNMVGSSNTGDFSTNPSVMGYDWFNDEIIASDYGSIPATTREGAAARNNLHIPMANQISDEMGRPVLIVAHPISGSRIDTWLESGTGENWANLNPEVTRALDLIGQDHADAFIWHQGESDYPLSTLDYIDKVEELIEQIRATDWAPSDLKILLGELSREGANFVQNIAYQQMEVENTDPNIGFVSSVGLTSDEKSGVHFNGPSLGEFGARYADELMNLVDNVPYDSDNVAPVTTGVTLADVTVAEGQELRIDLDGVFSDADGDDMFYYSYLSKRGVYVSRADQDTDELVLTPDYKAAGTYTVFVYASDMLLDGEATSFQLTITEATPLIDSYSSSTFAKQLLSYDDLDTAQGDLRKNRAVDILDNAVLDGGVEITVENLHLRGDASINGELTLGEGVLRNYHYGDAEFDVVGNASDNYVVGNDADSTMWGANGNDRFYGNGGTDVLFGEAGNDQLFGGDGDDILNAGTGSDSAWGGAGADAFIFSQGDGQLMVRDFDDADIISMNGFGFANFDALMDGSVLRQSGDRAMLDIGDDRLIINDMDIADVAADMFGFS